MAKRTFEFVDASSAKFWEVEVEGGTLTVRFGRIGTDGQTQVKELGKGAAAQAEKLIREKMKKGYVEVGASEVAPKKASGKKPAWTDPGVDALLKAIAKKEKDIELRPGASEEDLEYLQSLEVPRAFLALYAAHDGSEADFYGGYLLMHVDWIRSERESMNALLAENQGWRESGHWHERWVPFLSDQGGQLTCYDPVGSVDGAKPGTLVDFDHETGPAGGEGTFEQLVRLLTSLAKRKLLLADQDDEDLEEQLAEAYEEAEGSRDDGEAPVLSKAEWKKLEARLEALPEEAHGERLAIVEPLAKKHRKDLELWRMIVSLADHLGRWSLMAEAAITAESLVSKRNRPFMGSTLVFALHRAGRDDDALEALTDALKTARGYFSTYVPANVDSAFQLRCLRLATEVKPQDAELWLDLSRVEADPVARAAALKNAAGWGGKAAAGGEAHRYIELDRIATLAGKEKFEALVALARSEARPSWMKGVVYEETWCLAAACATALEDWAALDIAGEGLLAKLVSSTDHYKHARHRVLALHRLDRDDEALEVLSNALVDCHSADADLLEAVPWNDARVGSAALDPRDAPFEARCLAVLTDRKPDNAYAWYWRGMRATGAKRRSAFEKVVELTNPRADFVPDPDIEPEYNERNYRWSLPWARLRDDARAQMDR